MPPLNRAIRYISSHVLGVLFPPSRRMVKVNGCRMLLHQDRFQGIDSIAQDILLKGSYEPVTTHVFRQLVKEGMRVVDIGANIGYFTVLSARLTGEKGSVTAFEPEPRNFNLLIQNISLNGFSNVTANQKAVSDRAGCLELCVNPLEHGLHSLYPKEPGGGNTCPVESVNLDGYFGENKQIDFIKMDVEGAEPQVWRGMDKIIGHNPSIKIVTEFNPGSLKTCGFSAEEYWKLITENGFSFVYLLDDLRKKTRRTSLKDALKACRATVLNVPTMVNLLCSRSPVDLTVKPTPL